MGMHDRGYGRGDSPGSTSGGMGGLTVGLPKPTRVVKSLLIINFGVFVLQLFLDRPSRFDAGQMSQLLGVTVGDWWQVWRYVTFQFLHADAWHIIMNMLGVYFLGSPLESHWGPRRFLAVYLACGVTAGVAYVVIGFWGGLPLSMPIIGASGGVYGIVLACAVLFPHFRLIFLFFPVPIRLAALVIFGVMILSTTQAMSAGQEWKVMSDVAHLGGAAAMAVYVWVFPRLNFGQLRASAAKGAWERKMRQRVEHENEIDRVLKKIHDQGIASLTRGEKKLLEEASRRQREEERKLKL